MTTNNPASLTREDLQNELRRYPTKEDLQNELRRYATKEDLQNELRRYATKEDLQNELRNYATKEDVANLRVDMSQMETRLVKWMVGAVLAGTGIAATITLVIQRLVE